MCARVWSFWPECSLIQPSTVVHACWCKLGNSCVPTHSLLNLPARARARSAGETLATSPYFMHVTRHRLAWQLALLHMPAFADPRYPSKLFRFVATDPDTPDVERQGPNMMSTDEHRSCKHSAHIVPCVNHVFHSALCCCSAWQVWQSRSSRRANWTYQSSHARFGPYSRRIWL